MVRAASLAAPVLRDGSEIERPGLRQKASLSRDQLVRARQQAALGLARPSKQRFAVEHHFGVRLRTRDLELGDLRGEELLVEQSLPVVFGTERRLTVGKRGFEVRERGQRLVEVDQRYGRVVADRGVVPELERLAIARKRRCVLRVGEERVARLEQRERRLLIRAGDTRGTGSLLCGKRSLRV